MSSFSVVIPVFNSSNSILGVLKSVLDQTVSPVEIIVIDDASTDNSLSLILKFRDHHPCLNIKIIHLNINRGVSFCRNIGINKAVGDYIVFLDSDDQWHQNKLEVFSKIVDIYKPDLLGHKYSEKHFLINNVSFDLTKVKKIKLAGLLFRNIFQTSCVLIKNKKSYLFNNKMSFCEDYELFLNITERSNNSYFYDEILTKLGRPQLSKGGLSEKKIKMRLGEISAVTNILIKKKLHVLIPCFVVFSFVKYILKIFR
jgi:teichuronic acid biosynthesis glycosyltransferase TuaG